MDAHLSKKVVSFGDRRKKRSDRDRRIPANAVHFPFSGRVFNEKPDQLRITLLQNSAAKHQKPPPSRDRRRLVGNWPPPASSSSFFLLN
ncbi:hypothetical protein ACH5RR_013744, partial [Cinchona calisaya]